MSRGSKRWLTAAAVTAAFVVALALLTWSRAAEPAPATAAEAVATGSVAASPSVPASPSAAATRAQAPAPGYALDFTLPTYGKSGCLVCHGDPKLVVSKSSGNQSFYVDAEDYLAGAHGTIQCPGCHVDYGYKAPHNEPGVDWRVTAKQACKNCHKNEFRDYSLGVHAIRPVEGGLPDPKAAEKPLCGDCHEGHGMKTLEGDREAQVEMHLSGARMCGRDGCHADYFVNYDDYYHGAAYRAGALDAPACWDCHGAHTVLPSDNRTSPTNIVQIGSTCGECHEQANESYEGYLSLIHGRSRVAAANPVYAAISGIASGIRGLFE